MTVIDLRNSPVFGPSHPKLFKTDRLRDALADYLTEQHPMPGRRKAVRARFGLNDDEARSLCEGSPSPTTLDKVWRKEGWGIVLAVFTRLLGEGVDQHLEREKRRHAEQAERLGEIIRDLRVVADPRSDTAAGMDLQAGRVAPASDRRVGQRSFRRTGD